MDTRIIPTGRKTSNRDRDRDPAREGGELVRGCPLTTPMTFG